MTEHGVNSPSLSVLCACTFLAYNNFFYDHGNSLTSFCRCLVNGRYYRQYHETNNSKKEKYNSHNNYDDDDYGGGGGGGGGVNIKL